MSTITPNLNLFKIIPLEDAKKVFNFNEILNSNWDKIDLLPNELNLFKQEITDRINNELNQLKQEITAQVNETTNKLLELTKAVYRIGQPIIRLNNYINTDFEVRLEGGEELISKMPKLYAVYGNTYGSASSGYFKLPDFRNHALWGSNSFGYLAAGLPNIKGSFRTVQKNDRTTVSGAFTRKKNNDDGVVEPENNTVFNDVTFTFDASQNAAVNANARGIYRDNCYTVQPPAIKVRVVTRFK